MFIKSKTVFLPFTMLLFIFSLAFSGDGNGSKRRKIESVGDDVFYSSPDKRGGAIYVIVPTPRSAGRPIDGERAGRVSRLNFESVEDDGIPTAQEIFDEFLNAGIGSLEDLDGFSRYVGRTVNYRTRASDHKTSLDKSKKRFKGDGTDDKKATMFSGNIVIHRLMANIDEDTSPEDLAMIEGIFMTVLHARGRDGANSRAPDWKTMGLKRKKRLHKIAGDVKTLFEKHGGGGGAAAEEEAEEDYTNSITATCSGSDPGKTNFKKPPGGGGSGSGGIFRANGFFGAVSGLIGLSSGSFDR